MQKLQRISRKKSRKTLVLIFLGVSLIATFSNVQLKEKNGEKINFYKLLVYVFENEPKMKPALERPNNWNSKASGNLGLPATISHYNLTEEEIVYKKLTLYKYGALEYLSQHVSLHRRLKDTRPHE